MEHHQAAAILASERYVLDELTVAERDAFEEHYFTCAICAQEVKDLSVLKVAWKDASPQRRLAQERNVGEPADRKQGPFFLVMVAPSPIRFPRSLRACGRRPGRRLASDAEKRDDRTTGDRSGDASSRKPWRGDHSYPRPVRPVRAARM